MGVSQKDVPVQVSSAVLLYRRGFKSILEMMACRLPVRVRSSTTLSLISGRGSCGSLCPVSSHGISLVRLNVVREESSRALPKE